MQPNNPLSLGIYMSDGRLRPRPFDECLPNEELRGSTVPPRYRSAGDRRR